MITNLEVAQSVYVNILGIKTLNSTDILIMNCIPHMFFRKAGIMLNGKEYKEFSCKELIEYFPLCPSRKESTIMVSINKLIKERLLEEHPYKSGYFIVTSRYNDTIWG